ncbi:hypothetical protein AB0G15_05625 [Streptosporangium sp. NPDC023825]|uniref:hypothetical protein n=1 Tax=Streptosporangium sp. NPDC023825 TaxID=3154909 RepID=UPI0034313BE8
MIWYPAGAEIPGWRTLLYERGVRHMAMSYVGLGRRVKNTDTWSIGAKFPADVKVLLDSGGHTINKQNVDTDLGLLPVTLERYERFAIENLDRVSLAVELDAKALTSALRRAHRSRLHEVFQDRFLPIWDSDTGLNELQRLADTYGRVGVSQTVLGGRDITPVLRSLARAGTRLHGVAMTQIEAMRTIPWDSVASTSWLSPSQYGDTIIWTSQGELKRYPRRYADQARKRYRTYLTQHGFDAAAIEAGNSTELLRLSIWSWNAYVTHLNEQTTMVYLLHRLKRMMSLMRNYYPMMLINPLG